MNRDTNLLCCSEKSSIIWLPRPLQKQLLAWNTLKQFAWEGFLNADIIERREIVMCEHCGGHLEELKERPEECSQEQIKDCHGDVKNYPSKDED